MSTRTYRSRCRTLLLSVCLGLPVWLFNPKTCEAITSPPYSLCQLASLELHWCILNCTCVFSCVASQVVLSTDNIFSRCRARSKIGYPAETNPLFQLDVVGNFVSDLAAITRCGFFALLRAFLCAFLPLHCICQLPALDYVRSCLGRLCLVPLPRTSGACFSPYRCVCFCM